MIRFATLLGFLILVGKSNAQTTGAFSKTVVIGGSGTSVDYYVPTTYSASKSYKVIVNLEKAAQGHYLTYADTADGIVIGTDLSNYQFVKELVDSTNLTYNLDTNSVYLTGFSARGHKCLEIGLANHGYFKGLIPLAPNSSGGLSYPNGQFIPTCIVTGSADGFINTSVAIHGLMTFQSGIVDTLFPTGITHTPTGPDARTPAIHHCFQWINLNQPPGVGVDEKTGRNYLKVYPNPASELVTLQVIGGMIPESMTIYDLAGKPIEIRTNPRRQEVIDLSHMSNGMYLVVLAGQGQVVTRRLVVSR